MDQDPSPGTKDGNSLSTPKAAWWNGSQLTVLSGRKTSRNGCWIDSQQGLVQEFPGGPPVRSLGFHCHVPGQRSLLAACCCAVHS